MRRESHQTEERHLTDREENSPEVCDRLTRKRRETEESDSPDRGRIPGPAV